MFINLQKIFSVLPFYLLLTVLSACSNTSISYVEMNSMKTSPIEPILVEVIYELPHINGFHLGNITVNGNGFSNNLDIINAAKKKAGEIGANYIYCTNSGIEKKIVFNQNSSGYLTSDNILNCPWSIFSAWISKPSKTGINLNKHHIVIGFHLNCDAELAGMEIGDKVIGIDGIDINDRALTKHFMNMQPGSKCTYIVLRNEERKFFTITTLPN